MKPGVFGLRCHYDEGAFIRAAGAGCLATTVGNLLDDNAIHEKTVASLCFESACLVGPPKAASVN